MYCENCKYWSVDDKYGVCFNSKVIKTDRLFNASHELDEIITYQENMEECASSVRTGRKYGCVHFVGLGENLIVLNMFKMDWI